MPQPLRSQELRRRRGRARPWVVLVLAVAVCSLAGPVFGVRDAAASTLSDAEIDAELFGDWGGAPGTGETMRLIAEVEPEHWALAREVMRRSFETEDEAKRAALASRFQAILAAAQEQAMSRLAAAPPAALDAVGLAFSRLLIDLERRDPAACVGWAWPDDAAAAARFAALPREVVEPFRIENLRAARAARAAPAVYPAVDDAFWTRVRDGLQAWGATAEELQAQAAERRPKDLDDGQLCRLLGRLSVAMLRLPDELRSPALAFTLAAHPGPDPFAADAARLARIPAMSDADIDAMLLAAWPDLPGVGATLRMAFEAEPEAWRRSTSALRARFRPIDDAEVSSTAGALAFAFATERLRSRLAKAPTPRLEDLARAQLDALTALGRRNNGVCARNGYWLGPGDGALVYGLLPDEALRLVRATSDAVAAARDAPVERAPFDAASGPRLLAALAQAGFAPPAYTGPGEPIARPPDTEDGWCRFRARYVEALLRLPEAFRGRALADELSAQDSAE